MKRLFVPEPVIVTTLLFPSPFLSMARHALRTVVFKATYCLLCQDPRVQARRLTDHRRVLIACDRECNVVERAIGWLKQGHRTATRYEKTTANHLGFAAVRHGLRNPFTNIHRP